MATVTPCDLPPLALLRQLKAAGAFVDCYTAEIPECRSQAEFVAAFTTTRLFKLERWVLARIAGKPSSDVQAHELAQGLRNSFAVWTVESRAPDQLLLTEQTGSTRSWLMSEPCAEGGSSTRLFFGSAVMPNTARRSGQRRFGLMFTLLLAVHRVYSQALLRAAVRKLATPP